MAKFVYLDNISLTSEFNPQYFDGFEPGDVRKYSVQGDTNGCKFLIKGGPFREYTDAYWDDDGLSGAMDSLSLSRAGTTMFKATGLDTNIKYFFGAGNQLSGGLMLERLFKGDDVIIGSAKADELDGKAGDDRILGGAGNDVLFGYTGVDTIVGGLGQDRLDGGTGADRFVFNDIAESRPGDKSQDIVTFDRGDLIVLKTIDADVTVRGNQAFHFVGAQEFSHTAGELRYDGEDYLVVADVDGDGVSDFTLDLGAWGPPSPTPTEASFIL